MGALLAEPHWACGYLPGWLLGPGCASGCCAPCGVCLSMMMMIAFPGMLYAILPPLLWCIPMWQASPGFLLLPRSPGSPQAAVPLPTQPLPPPLVVCRRSPVRWPAFMGARGIIPRAWWSRAVGGHRRWAWCCSGGRVVGSWLWWRPGAVLCVSWSCSAGEHCRRRAVTVLVLEGHPLRC